LELQTWNLIIPFSRWIPAFIFLDKRPLGSCILGQLTARASVVLVSHRDRAGVPNITNGHAATREEALAKFREFRRQPLFLDATAIF